MKILKLTAENIKKLRCIEITPTGEIVTIAGKNGQGKTSVLDSIWWALAGTSHIQAKPIRKGASKARVRLDLGELIVERRFTENGSTLAVESADGARYPSPQKMLDALIGELSFDPLAFARMDAGKQFEELRRVSKLDVDIVHLDGLNRADYAARTDVNREAKAKRAAAAAITVRPDLPTQPVNEEAILDRIQSAASENAQIEVERSKRGMIDREIVELEKLANEQYAQAEELREQANELVKRSGENYDTVRDLKQLRDTAKPLPEPVDVANLRLLLDAAKETNALLKNVSRRDELESEAFKLEAKSRELTFQIEAREQAKREAIMSAAMPVDGLGFGDGIVTFNGVPFDQASSAEQLRVSLSIAMAANPKLRVIRIQDGSLLDDESLEQIAVMAKGSDYQVWIERVDNTGKVGIIIEDGAVQGAPVPAECEP